MGGSVGEVRVTDLDALGLAGETAEVGLLVPLAALVLLDLLPRWVDDEHL
jgi:hypothetical protein